MSALFSPEILRGGAVKELTDSDEEINELLVRPSDILFAGVHVCTFQPGNFTGWGSEGVN